MKNNTLVELVQVCYDLNPDNLNRELNGLLQAMKFFNHQKATIVTFSKSDFIQQDGFEISVIPAYNYLLTKP